LGTFLDFLEKSPQKPEFAKKQGKTLNIYQESAYIFVGLEGLLWHAENHETTHHH
jgi:hypothetical protein